MSKLLVFLVCIRFDDSQTFRLFDLVFLQLADFFSEGPKASLLQPLFVVRCSQS